MIQDTMKEDLDDALEMSKHWNGYKRENAVRSLGMFKNPIAIPNLIVRANDWVPQVRNAARDSLKKLFKRENAKAFILSLPDLYHLQNCKRSDHGTLNTQVTNFLLEPDNVGYIKLAINNNPHVARIAIRLCIENSLLNKQKLVSDTLSHSDVVVRKIAASFLCDFAGDTLELFLQQAIQDPFMPVRREAFQIYLRVFPEKGLKIAYRFLYDRHFSIREIAIKYLLKNDIDVEKTLINMLLSAPQSALKLRSAMLGLAEIGSKKSIPLIKNFSSYSLPSIKKSALQSLALLIGETSLPYLIDGLKDVSPSVSKESSHLIHKLNINLSVEVLIDIIVKANHHHTLFVCLSSAKKINKWNRLIFLLKTYKLLVLSNSTQEKILDCEITKWDLDINHSSSQPSKTQIEHLIVEYNKNNEHFSEERLKSIEFTIKSLGAIV